MLSECADRQILGLQKLPVVGIYKYVFIYIVHFCFSVKWELL